MGLMTLLPTSRAFRKIQDRPGRYNLSHLGLPKFGPVNPAERKAPAGEIAAKPVTAASQEVPPRQPKAAPQAGTMIMKRIENVFGGKSKAAGPEAEPAPAVAPIVAAPRKKRRFFFSGWTLFKNPFNRGAKSKTPAPIGPVQPELWLDRVKPVRNDLSDSDIEVVPAAKPAAAGPPGALPQPIPPDATPVEARWSGIRRQFLDAGKS